MLRAFTTLGGSVVLGACSILLFCRYPALRSVDGFIYALHFPRPAKSDDRLLLVEIDDATVARYGLLPWDRSIWADVFARVSRAGPKVIAVDVLFEELDETSPALAEAIRNTGNVVLAAAPGTDVPGTWLEPSDDLARSALAIGNVAITGPRSIPLSQRHSEARVYRSFALEVCDRFLGYTCSSEGGVPSSSRASVHNCLLSGVDPVEMDCHGRVDQLAIAWIGGLRAFRRVSLTHVMEGRVDPSTMRDVIVLIGATYRGSGDHGITPLSVFDAEPTPGMVIHANAIHTILNSMEIRGLLAFESLFVAALFGLIGLRMGEAAEGAVPGHIGLPIGLVIASFLVATWFVFEHWQLHVNVTPCLVALGLGTLTAWLGARILRLRARNIE